jgi:predicted transcriptional regulator
VAELQVPENLSLELQHLAELDGRNAGDLLTEALTAYVADRYAEPKLTAGQIDRLRESLAQLDRGEFITEKEVGAFFDDWEKELSSK